jgi:hypothetical protein
MMRSMKGLIAALAVAMLLSTGAFAGADLNEVGAFLVYPAIVGAAQMGAPGEVETFVTITNAGPSDVVAHVSYINGDENDEWQYCYECDFEIPLTGNDTETLVISNADGGGVRIQSEDLYLDLACPWSMGMLVVALENAAGDTITDNVLLGEEVLVNYVDGAAFSIPAIPFQGLNGNGDREYEFNDAEYAKLPRIVAADFLAPVIGQEAIAELYLFTLGFERQFPPLVDCSVIGFDAEEHPFSASFQFGCWTLIDLYEISPEFYYPNLGLFDQDPDGIGPNTHGWLQLNCRVDKNPAAADGFEADGGVHGAIVQTQWTSSWLPAGSQEPFVSTAFWGRLLYQSVTTGDDVTLILEAAPLGLD